ncbi:MAG: hypothetical protein ACI8S6_000605 [Myxococcota bacterium]|jgi:hypothetical protein
MLAVMSLILSACWVEAPTLTAQASSTPAPAPVLVEAAVEVPEAVVPAPSVPLNEMILETLGTYPLGDAIPYFWVRGLHTDGVSQLLQWRGEVLAEPSAKPGVHCSGITFEVYVRSLLAVRGDEGLSADEMRALKVDWYNESGGRGGPVDALVSRGLGAPIDTLEALEPGDLIQIWRNSGNGHSAVFIDHTRRRSGAIRGLVFWSAQSSSEGIGYRRVSIGSDIHQLSPGPEGLRGVRAGAAP